MPSSTRPAETTRTRCGVWYRSSVIASATSRRPHIRVPDTSTPETVLASLMEEHRLRQTDLPEVGAQSVVSAILSGRRRLNLRQVKALAARFGVPMEVFA